VVVRPVAAAAVPVALAVVAADVAAVAAASLVA
jgi:hypothetical protein